VNTIAILRIFLDGAHPAENGRPMKDAAVTRQSLGRPLALIGARWVQFTAKTRPSPMRVPGMSQSFTAVGERQVIAALPAPSGAR
jgi:hypothetical protein